MVKADTNPAINFQLVVGEHVLRFNPKDQFKNELSLRSLTLPYLCLQGNLRQSKKKKLPQLTVDLFVRKLNIDLTTDILNQLLVVQNTFIKVCVLISVGVHVHLFWLPVVKGEMDPDFLYRRLS